MRQACFPVPALLCAAGPALRAGHGRSAGARRGARRQAGAPTRRRRSAEARAAAGAAAAKPQPHRSRAETAGARRHAATAPAAAPPCRRRRRRLNRPRQPATLPTAPPPIVAWRRSRRRRKPRSAPPPPPPPISDTATSAATADRRGACASRSAPGRPTSARRAPPRSRISSRPRRQATTPASMWWPTPRARRKIPRPPRRLSLSRALAVRSALMADGVSSARIYVRALGARPATDRPTGWTCRDGRQRVDASPGQRERAGRRRKSQRK